MACVRGGERGASEGFEQRDVFGFVVRLEGGRCDGWIAGYEAEERVGHDEGCDGEKSVDGVCSLLTRSKICGER